MDLSFNLTRDSQFRYTCNRCRKCCHNQRISLNPYEVLRLSRNRGVSTGELIALGTDEAGTLLRFAADDETSGGTTCVFLGEEGCSVHADRPLACRLYPLGRYVAPDGNATFARLAGHPESAGIFGAPDEMASVDTVGTYVDSQGVQPYVRAAERYFVVFQRLFALLARAGEREDANGEPTVVATWQEADVRDWMDVDAVVSDYCSRQGRVAPEDIEDVMLTHISAMAEWADDLERDLCGAMQ